jgi:hypothetical protein
MSRCACPSFTLSATLTSCGTAAATRIAMTEMATIMSMSEKPARGCMRCVSMCVFRLSAYADDPYATRAATALPRAVRPTNRRRNTLIGR